MGAAPMGSGARSASGGHGCHPLAFHLASRSRRVVRAIREQPGAQLDVSQVHVDPTPVP
jgi:hypothetical protein